MDQTDCNTMQFWQRPGHFALVGIAVTLCLHTGCQTWQKSHEAAVAQFGTGDLQASMTALQESQKALRSERKLVELDLGILDLASGNVKQAEDRFRNLRHELEYLEQADVAEQASSVMTDSRAVAFSGRDFERRMILNMALLSSILSDGQDSFAYSLQVLEAAAERKNAIAATETRTTDSSSLAGDSTVGRRTLEISPAAFHSEQSSSRIPASSLDQPLALSSYLAAAVQSESPSRHEETELALNDIDYWNPAFRRPDQTGPNGQFGTHCKPGHGTLHIFAMVGKAPRWVSESAAPTSAALLIADRIISATGKHTLPPTIASVKIARPEPGSTLLPAGSLRCSVNSSDDFPEAAPVTSLTFSTLVNLNEVALASYEEHRDNEIAKAISRRIIKKGAIYVLKETQSIHRNSFVDLGVNVAGIAWEAMEKADTRSWRMLPARLDVARTELPAGKWTTTLQVNHSGSSRDPQTVPVQIADGRNTFILCIIPEQNFTGHILVGGADNSQKSVP